MAGRTIAKWPLIRPETQRLLQLGSPYLGIIKLMGRKKPPFVGPSLYIMFLSSLLQGLDLARQLLLSTILEFFPLDQLNAIKV